LKTGDEVIDAGAKKEFENIKEGRVHDPNHGEMGEVEEEKQEGERDESVEKPTKFFDKMGDQNEETDLKKGLAKGIEKEKMGSLIVEGAEGAEKEK
jgi:hypothetical protein